MSGNGQNSAQDLMWRIQKFIKDELCRNIAKQTIDKYTTLDNEINTSASISIAESLGWIAEYTKNPEFVAAAALCYQSDNIIDVIRKYRGDVAEEILVNIEWVAESGNRQNVDNYVSWVDSRMMSGFLDFATGLDNNGGLKLKKNIFSLLNLPESKIGMFSDYAKVIYRRKLPIDKKLELLNIIRTLSVLGKEDHIRTLIRSGVKGLLNKVESELGGISLDKDVSSVLYGIKFTEDVHTDPNLMFLLEMHRAHGSIGNWMRQDGTVTSLIGELEAAGINTEKYVCSGHVVGYVVPDNNYMKKHEEIFSMISRRILGSRKNGILPSVTIKNIGPTRIFHKIKGRYKDAINGDTQSITLILNKYKEIIGSAYGNGKVHHPVSQLLKDIDELLNMIRHGGVLNYRGAKLTARVWRRKIPYDLYDSEMLRCCMYLPKGEMKYEIPLLVMDPKTTLVQYFIKGISIPVASASFYAGMVEGDPTLLMDTWDAGGLAYSALGHDKMKEFVIETIKKFGKMSGSRVVVYSKGEYGRPEEFCNFLKKKHEIEEVNFKSIDPDNVVLQKFSKTKKHHFTDAFNLGKMEGIVPVFKL